MDNILNIFGENTIYIFIAIAVLIFWKDANGKALAWTLLEKFLKPKEDTISKAQVSTVEEVKPIKTGELISSVGENNAVQVTLVNQNLSKLSIENKE